MALLKTSDSAIDDNTIISHQNRLAIGIDLGTTNSLAATVKNEKAIVLTDSEGRCLLPSVAYYQNQGCIVGYDAQANAVKDPANTIISIKRMIGRSLKDIQHRYPNLPYHLQASDNGLPMILTNRGLLTPIEVSADILRALLTTRVSVSLHNTEGVVITVPAYFDDAQRQGTKDAAQLAGLHVLRLLNEPTAAAIAYGLDSKKEGIVAIYDLGGGTFDISILHLNRGIFEVLAIGGNSDLGGDDFDHLLADFLRKQIGILDYSDIHIQRELLNTAITAKMALSKMQNVTINIADWKGNISCNQFNKLIFSLVDHTIFSCRRTLKDAGVKVEEVREVVMVGGSTRIPLVRNRVSEFFGRIPLTTIDPDKVVAIGAAIQADILVGNKTNNEILLLDVIPLSLGIETIGGLVEKLIPRNTTIPITCTQEFTTFKNKQTAISIHVVQGERELVQDCRSLARFSLRGIPALPAGAAHIRVIFQVDANGLLSVTAMEKSTGIKTTVKVQPSYGLTDSEIAKMIHDSVKNSKRDMYTRMLIEQKIEATRILDSLDNALVVDATLLSIEERQEIDIAATELRIAVKSNNLSLIKESIINTNKKTQRFATRRMEKSICQAIKGQYVDEI